MAGKYRAFKYETDVYGNFGPTITQSYLFAQATDYDTVQITMEVPDKVGQQYILVRSNHGSAEDPSDGYTVATGTVTAGVITVTDSTVNSSTPTYTDTTQRTAGTTYYTLFGLDDDGAWYKDAATSVIIPTNKGTGKKIIDVLPSMYTSADSNPLSPTEYDSDLGKFLYAFALTYDELSSMIDFILPENRDRHTTRRLSDIFVTGVGMPSEYLIGVAANARLYRESGYIYRNKGTLNGIATYAEALTGWQTVVKDSNNKFLSLDDGSFETSTGNWSWDATEMSLSVAAIDDTTVVGPTIEYETADYPFSRQGVGRAQLLATSAKMSLGALNRLVAIPVTGGKSHFLAVPSRAVAGNPVVVPSVEWLDQYGNSISTSYLSDISTTSTWQVAGGPVIAPATAAFAALHIQISGSVGNILHFDMLSFSEETAKARTNFFLNPSAEFDLDSVGLVDTTGRSLATSPAQYKYGAQSFELTSSDTTARTLGLKNTANIPAVSGETFTGSAYVYSTKAATIFLTFTWKNGSSTITTSTGDSVAVSANTWTRLDYTVTAPNLTTNLVFAVQTSTTYTNTQSLFVDGLLVEKSDRLGDWFAGSTGTTYGASGRYGDFVYSTYDVGYIYRDPRSVTVICQPDRINLVFDPSFELGTTSWTIDAGNLQTSTDTSVSGTKSGKATGATWAFRSNDIPINGNFAYSFSVFAKSEAGSANAEVKWYDYTDSLLRTDTASFSSLGSDWSRLEETLYSPPTAVYATLNFNGSGTVYLDNVLFERSDRPQIFFSGGLSDLDNQDGRWSGTGPNSYSLLYNKAPIKLGRLRQTLPYYLPVGVSARVLLWDSLDPEVQALIPRGIYQEN